MANPTLLSRLLCADADKNTIPDTDAGTAGVFSQQYGWQAINSLPLSAGGKAVQRQDFNGVFNLLGGIAFYTQKGYTWEWDSSQDYFVGCIVIDPNDSNRYECISDVTANATPPSADTTHWQIYGVFDIGDLKFIAHNNTIPNGWFLCDGSAVSRTTYAELFAVIGTTYGVGDGTTTFNLPNYIDNFAQGSATAGTVKNAGLPNIKGTFAHVSSGNVANVASPSYSGAFAVDTTLPLGGGVNSGSSSGAGTSFDASRSSAIYSDNVTTVQPPALTCRVLIKYE